MYVELLFVILPFMALILGLCQTALLYVGGLAVQRSASVAARAAMVVLDDDPKRYGTSRNKYSGARKRDIELAASFPLLAIETSPLSANGSVEDALNVWSANPLLKSGGIGKARGLTVKVNGGGNRGSKIRAYVKYEFPCVIPFARIFMCGGKSVTLEAQSTLPNQAASYKYGKWL